MCALSAIQAWYPLAGVDATYDSNDSVTMAASYFLWLFSDLTNNTTLDLQGLDYRVDAQASFPNNGV